MLGWQRDAGNRRWMMESFARGPCFDGTTRTMLYTPHMPASHTPARESLPVASPARGTMARAVTACVTAAILLPLASCGNAPSMREAHLQLRADPIEAIEFGEHSLSLADGSAASTSSSRPAPEVRLALWPWAQGASSGVGTFASLPGDASRPLASRLASAPSELAAEFTGSLGVAP
jgi:hypothetical protein